jgi:hypothetical protein
MTASMSPDETRDEARRPPPRRHLIVAGPHGALPVLLPDTGVFIIGRADDADVLLNDPLA